MNNNFDCYNEEMKPPFDLMKTKSHITKVSLFVFALAVISLCFQQLGAIISEKFFPNFYETYQYIWTLSIIPLYLFALPLAFLILKKADTHKIVPEIKKYKFYHMLGFIAVSVLFMYAGSIIGTIIMNIITSITGKEIDNKIGEILMNSPWWLSLIATVIVAPFGEEFIFRKLLIDRVNVYGQKFAIVFSAVAFSLFHGNLNQLFYTFTLGLVFAYVYTKTGKLRYSIILHAVINFFGGVVAPYITNNIDQDKLNAIGEMSGQQMAEYMLELLPFLLYGAIALGFAIAGLVLLINYRKKINLIKGEIEIPKKEFGGCVFYNLGTASFLVYSAVVLVLSCLPSK